jgi:hypothetical protein
MTRIFPALIAGVADRHKECLQRPIRALKQQDALRRQAIAPRAAGFLRVDLERGWQVVVNHGPDVWSVDPHAKGVGGDDEWHAATHEGILRSGTITRAYSTVI